MLSKSPVHHVNVNNVRIQLSYAFRDVGRPRIRLSRIMDGIYFRDTIKFHQHQ